MPDTGPSEATGAPDSPDKPSSLNDQYRRLRKLFRRPQVDGQVTAFDLRTVSDSQRAAYFGSLFAMAAVDGVMDRDEIGLIFDVLEQQALPAASSAQLRSYLVAPPDLDACLQTLSTCSPQLRYGVMAALTDVALADAFFAPPEQEAIRQAQERLDITQEQLKAIETFSRKAAQVRERGLDDSIAAETLKTAAAGLTAVGIPITAVYFSGTVIGLSASGITSGLAALGLGLGMVPGVGVVVLIGVGVYTSVSYVLQVRQKRAKREAAAHRERIAQLVIRRLQDAINELVTKVVALQEDGALARANAEAIRDLNLRLHALKQLLAKRQAAAA